MMERNRLRTCVVIWTMLTGIFLVTAEATTVIGGLPLRSNEAVQQIFYLANQDRAAYGLQPLHWDRALAMAAVQHANRMMEENTLSHQYSGEPDLLTRAVQAGAHFQALAENIA
ncbi:MAG TPA: CAP domain-containing protein, partial [Silvibacterium sp.]|nr:CAP domain-containing protein [Silvibacterium sp.]